MLETLSSLHESIFGKVHGALLNQPKKHGLRVLSSAESKWIKEENLVIMRSSKDIPVHDT
jgi:hypothetical protein